MGSVFNRGTRDNPLWYGKWKHADGKWKMEPTHQPTKEQAKKYVAKEEANVSAGGIGMELSGKASLCGPLMETWMATLLNRNASDDESRIKRCLIPVFKDTRVRELERNVGMVLDWIGKQRTAPEDERLSDGSIRHNLNLLSRFYGWAIERGYASINPVRQIPQGRRPHQSQKRDLPWLNDDALVRTIMSELPKPFDLMFYIGNRSGLRTGEICGLRMSDLDFLSEGSLRVRFSYDGPLKEDKHSDGKMKWVPAPMDGEAVLGPWLAQRKLQRAGPEDYLFPCANRGGSYYRKEFIEQQWEAVANKEDRKLELTWYQATRHSFVSRSLTGGASLDEVSAAIGHSSPVVTRRYYDHFVRKTFSPGVRAGLGLDKPRQDAPVTELPAKRSRKRNA